MSERFLISRLSALGDVVCSLPAAVALKRGFPDCEVTWVVDPRFAAIPERCSAVDRVITAKPGFSVRSWPKVEGRFDAALDLQGLSKSAVVVARSRAARKVGFHWQREGAWLFSQAVRPDPSSYHIVDQYVDVARAVGGVSDRAEFGFASRPEDDAAIQAKLEEAKVDGRFAVMNAGAGWATKRWPVESCAKLIDLLAADGIKTVLIGGRADEDKAVAEQVCALSQGKPVDFTGRTSIAELIALIAACDVHVGGDTGSSHLAAALGKPAVGLYSITRPRRSCPYGQIERSHYDPDGLAKIGPNEVYRTLMEIFS